MIFSASRYPAISCSSRFFGVVFSSTSCFILVFVIMSILEVVQNTDNYKTLLKLGVPAKSVKSSVFKQVTSYFFILSEFVMINVIYSFLLFSKHKTLFNQAKILPYVFGKTFAPIFLLLVISYIMVVSVCRRIVNKSILQSDNYCE